MSQNYKIKREDKWIDVSSHTCYGNWLLECVRKCLSNVRWSMNVFVHESHWNCRRFECVSMCTFNALFPLYIFRQIVHTSWFFPATNNIVPNSIRLHRQRTFLCGLTHRHALADVWLNLISSEIASNIPYNYGKCCCGDFRVQSIVLCTKIVHRIVCTRIWIHLGAAVARGRNEMFAVKRDTRYQIISINLLSCFRECFRNPISPAKTRSHTLHRLTLLSWVFSWYCRCDWVINCLSHRPHSYGFGWLLSQYKWYCWLFRLLKLFLQIVQVYAITLLPSSLVTVIWAGRLLILMFSVLGDDRCLFE